MKSSFLLFTSPFLSFLLVLPCRLLRESLILELGPVQGEFNHYKAHSFRGRDKQGIFKHSKNDFILWVSLSPHILESPFVEFIWQRTTELLSRVILILQKFEISNFACCQIVPICSLISELFLDAIASPCNWCCQWASE